IVAAGAFEQPAVFGNNDLPGVMLATAAQRLIHLFAVKPFDQGVVLTANAEGYRAALDLHPAGIHVEIVIDLRPEGEPSAVAPAPRLRARGGGGFPGPTREGEGRGGVGVPPLDPEGRARPRRAFDVNGGGGAAGVGGPPADGLFYQAGGRMTWSDALQQYVP